MLLDALGPGEASLSTAELRSAFNPDLTARARSADAATYYSSDEPPGSRRLRDLILESAFYSRHLYGKAASRALLFVVLVLIGVVTALFVAVPAATDDWRLLVARVLVVVLGSALLFELLEAGLAWWSASAETGAVLRRAERADLSDQYTALSFVGDYSAATAAAPPIPSDLYAKEREHLDSIWADYRLSAGSAS